MPNNYSEIMELKLDVEEARALLASASRKRWKDLLSIELLKIESTLNNLQGAADSGQGVKDSTPTSVTSGQTKAYSTIIRNYSWDQSDKFLKLYLTLNGVQKLKKENIICNFGKQSVTFRALELDGKNHELNVAVLAYPIVPENSHFKVKNDMVVVLAAKAQQNAQWEVVTAEEKRALDKKKSKAPDAAGGKDPSAGIMDLMKQMYDDGDDDTKRMLKKTWFESQQKTNGGMGGLPDLGEMNL